MGKTIVFLNLADRDPAGLAGKSVASLRKKYPHRGSVKSFFMGANEVYNVDLFELLENQRDASYLPKPSGAPAIRAPSLKLSEVERETLAIRLLCDRADKIMLGIHGKFDNTTHGFAAQGWGEGHGVGGDYREYSQLLKQFLKFGGTYKIALIVCYGARSENYRLDHDGMLSKEDIKSSFAYKFFKEIYPVGNITMTARTGSVMFNASTGKSEVQSELAVSAEIDDNEIQRAPETKNIDDKYRTLKTRMELTPSDTLAFDAMEERMSARGSHPRNDHERIIKNYLDMIGRLHAAADTKADQFQKSGKFVYRYDRARGYITVQRKYEDAKKVMRVLYEGLP
jgi:hypothetical protein